MAYQELKKCFGQKLNPDPITKLIIRDIHKYASKESANTAADIDCSPEASRGKAAGR